MTDVKEVNDKIDSLSEKIIKVFKKIIGAIPFPNFLKFSLDQETVKQAVNSAPDKSTNWGRMGLSKTWWAFLAIGAALFAGVARMGVDVFYRIAMFVIDFWVAIVFVFVGILLLRMLGVWNAILSAIIKFLNGFKNG